MKFDTFHFVGIGGIGMSAIARILLERGKLVSGSDTKASFLTNHLQSIGAKIFIGHEKENVKEGCVVYSSAIDPLNAELVQARHLQLPVLHRSDLLNELMMGFKPLLVTGTHGKTTTTALLSWVLEKACLNPSFVVGGIVESLSSNAKYGTGSYFVAEADESDGSFLKTKAFGAIVTNLEMDHMDFWGSFEKLKDGFSRFVHSVQKPEHLFWCGDDPILSSLKPPGVSYGFGKDNLVRILKLESSPRGICFDLSVQGQFFSNISLSLLGKHNALNAASVFALCLSLGVDSKCIYDAFQSFRGVKRRLEIKRQEKEVIWFDDYGHHPTEIKATLKALKQASLERRIVCYFQPHRYTRLASLFKEFIHCFDDADLLFISDVYAAGECVDAQVDSKKLVSAIEEMGYQNVVYVSKENEIETIASHLRSFDVFLTIGAGDITHRGDPILDAFVKKNNKIRALVLYGGASSEHEVSKMSAKNIIHFLNSEIFDITSMEVSKMGVFKDGFEEETRGIHLRCLDSFEDVDVVIPVFHGPFGEDGMIQGFLDTLGLAYVGCSYESSSLCMHKAWTKHVVANHFVPIVPFLEKSKRDFLDQQEFIASIEESLVYPVWVKPCHLGSSIGVSRAQNREELVRAVQLAFIYDEMILIEKEIKGREIEFAVLGNEDIRISSPCAILNQGVFYDFEKKYGSNAFSIEIPASISSEQIQLGKSLAKKAYLATQCQGLARVDFFLDEDGNFWFNEINTFPGFTKNSGYPKMWEASGLTQEKLLNELVVLAFAKQRLCQKIHKRTMAQK